MLVKTEEEGKLKDVGLLEVTPENFIVPTGQESSYHCRIEVVKFNSETGERISKPRLQVFGRKFFESFGLHNLKKMGYKVDILHDPKKWEAENSAKIEQKKKELAEAAKQAEKEKLKAEILAELEEQGKLKSSKKASKSKEDEPAKEKAEKTAGEEKTE
jgi:hypothetical protein